MYVKGSEKQKPHFSGSPLTRARIQMFNQCLMMEWMDNE